MIKFPDDEFFILLDLDSKLKYYNYNRLSNDLKYLDLLRIEIKNLLEKINIESKQQKIEI